VYEDRESAGGKPREQFQKLFEDVTKPKRPFDVLLFWSLDRFSREGVYETLHRLKELDRAGVQFLSLQEQYLDTLGPFREAVLGILAAVAKLERNRLSERVKAGVARVRRDKKAWGRKPCRIDESKLKRMRKKGYSLSEIAGVLKVSRTTVFKRLQQITES
jgi:DNA invertase Pin-like site-specific DNA recombinase